MAWLAEHGYFATVVEYHGRHGRTHDLLGFVDILAFTDGETVAVQTTDITNVAARVTKIEASPWLGPVVDAGWRVVVHGWRPAGYAGELPELRIVQLS